MNLQKLLHMNTSEFVGRSRQEMMKVLERLGLTDEAQSQYSRSANVFTFEAPLYFLSKVKSRFYRGALDLYVPETLARSQPGHAVDTIRRAEDICRGLFPILGYGNISFGTPVDWHRDPLSGNRCPRVHWSKVNPLDYHLVGDHKIVWELNRHQWLLDLGQAYQFTHDERYASTFAARINEWIDQNPHGIGINWVSSLEISMRLVSWCWALCLFRGSNALSARLFKRMLESIRLHARHIERYLSTYFSPNTHLTGEAIGLCYAGTLFPELPESGRWRDQGRKILEESIEDQVFSDGVYFEQSACYQYYTLEFYLHYVLLSMQNDVDVSETVRKQVERMLEFLLAVRFPDGTIPQIGDTDGGWFVPLVRRKPGDFRGLFSIAALIFRRGDFAWAAEGVGPEAYWLMGAEVETEFDSIEVERPRDHGQQYFREGGYCVLRDGFEADSHHLLMDVGRLGCPYSGGHGHADALSIQCAAFGETFLIDPGTFCYTSQPVWRDYFRGTSAHSTVMIDRQSQYLPEATFSWQDINARARLLHRESTSDYDLIEADHNAYQRLGVTHRRRVLFLSARYWLVIDDISGEGTHQVDICFQFAPLRVSVEEERWVRAEGTRGHDLLMKTFSASEFQMSVLEGAQEPRGGWYSRTYGQRVRAPQLRLHTTGNLPARFLTLLYPVAEAGAVPPHARFDERGTSSTLEVHSGSISSLHITDTGVRCVWH